MDSSPDIMPSAKVNFRPVFHRCRSRYPASYLVDFCFGPYTKVTDSKALHSSESNSPAPKLYSPKSPRRSARTQKWRQFAVNVLVVGSDGYCDWKPALNLLAGSDFRNAERISNALCFSIQTQGLQCADHAGRKPEGDVPGPQPLTGSA
jgi:hypothetical protein